MSERQQAWRKSRWLWIGLALTLLDLQVPVAHAEVATSARPSAVALAAGSEGCGRPPPAIPPTAIEVQGRQRSLIMVTPAGYRQDRPHALVIAFHGRTGSNAKARGYYDLEQAASAPTIFVYPSGLRAAGHYNWSEPGDPARGLRDFALFDALVGTISRLYCIDPRRIFAVGHSLGAWFVNSLACARGDVLRAIGTVAGGISPSACRGRVAAILFHNPKDRLVDIRAGREARDLLRARSGEPGPARAAVRDRFGCERYGTAGAWDPVLWCPYTGERTRTGRYYPHHWPKHAARAIMGFFAALPGAPEAAATRRAAADPKAPAWPCAGNPSRDGARQSESCRQGNPSGSAARNASTTLPVRA